MEHYDLKIKKIREINHEVRFFHPLLKDLLPNLPSVSNVTYTHGQNEMGADFVVTLRDLALNEDEYVGLIVKCGDIRQNHDDIERQIKECLLPRKISGGKKNIYLNQIWVVTNGRVSENAKDKIFEEHKNKNIKFIWDEKLVELVDKYYPVFWANIDRNIAIYLSAISGRIEALNLRFGLLDLGQSDFYIEQAVVQVKFAQV